MTLTTKIDWWQTQFTMDADDLFFYAPVGDIAADFYVNSPRNDIIYSSCRTDFVLYPRIYTVPKFARTEAVTLFFEGEISPQEIKKVRPYYRRWSLREFERINPTLKT